MHRGRWVTCMSVLALLCGFAAVVGHRAGFLAHGSTRDPKAVSLILSDLPHGTTVVRAKDTINTNLARVVSVPYAPGLGRLGFLHSYLVEFQIGNGGALHLTSLLTEVANPTSVYDTAAHARTNWLAAVTALNESPRVQHVASDAIGNKSSAWAQSISSPGPSPVSVSGYIIVFYRSPFLVRVETLGPKSLYSLAALEGLAKTVDGRIERSLKS
jgi:hypothetical protein